MPKTWVHNKPTVSVSDIKLRGHKKYVNIQTGMGGGGLHRLRSSVTLYWYMYKASKWICIVSHLFSPG